MKHLDNNLSLRPIHDRYNQPTTRNSPRSDGTGLILSPDQSSVRQSKAHLRVVNHLPQTHPFLYALFPCFCYFPRPDDLLYLVSMYLSDVFSSRSDTSLFPECHRICCCRAETGGTDQFLPPLREAYYFSCFPRCVILLKSQKEKPVRLYSVRELEWSFPVPL